MANALQKRAPAKKKDPSGQPSMKWYDFLKDLGLYLYAVVMALIGCVTISGLVNPQAVEQLKLLGAEYLITVDMVSCVLQFALAAYAVLIRFALAKKKAKAPLLLVLLHGADIVVNLALLLIRMDAADMLGQQVDLVSSILPIVVGGALVVINLIYFHKRKALFQN